MLLEKLSSQVHSLQTLIFIGLWVVLWTYGLKNGAIGDYGWEISGIKCHVIH